MIAGDPIPAMLCTHRTASAAAAETDDYVDVKLVQHVRQVKLYEGLSRST